MDYIEMIEKVKNYIEENLEHVITLEDIAKHAYLSKFHFHRIFQDEVGESVMEYVRKMRLSKAAIKLINTDEKIIDVAMQYQFNSHDTFTRAFSRYFVLTPSAFRKLSKSFRSDYKVIRKISKNLRSDYRVIIRREKIVVLDWELGNRIQCNEIEKDECIELLNNILMFSQKSRKYGLLSLESEVEKCEDLFLKKGTKLIISGTNPEFVKEIMGTYIVSGNYRGKELLKRVIALEGLLAIQRGESHNIILERLAAYFGENYLNKLENYFGMNDEQKIKEYFEKIKSKQPVSSDTYLLEEIFKGIDNRSTQRILREIDVTDIVNALSGSSGKVQRAVLDNVSKHVLLILIEELSGNKKIDNKQVIESQQKIINIIERLKQDKEII